MNREAPPLTPSQARAAYEFMMVAGWRGHAADEWRHTARLLADAALAPNVSAGVGRSLLDRAAECLAAAWVASGRRAA
jgi:hypothetical protein